eukprot:182980_1
MLVKRVGYCLSTFTYLFKSHSSHHQQNNQNIRIGFNFMIEDFTIQRNTPSDQLFKHGLELPNDILGKLNHMFCDINGMGTCKIEYKLYFDIFISTIIFFITDV